MATPRSKVCDSGCFHRNRSTGECIIFKLHGPGDCLFSPPMSPEEIRHALDLVDADAGVHRRGVPDLVEVRNPAAYSGTAMGLYRVQFVRDDS